MQPSGRLRERTLYKAPHLRLQKDMAPKPESEDVRSKSGTTRLTSSDTLPTTTRETVTVTNIEVIVTEVAVDDPSPCPSAEGTWIEPALDSGYPRDVDEFQSGVLLETPISTERRTCCTEEQSSSSERRDVPAASVYEITRASFTDEVTTKKSPSPDQVPEATWAGAALDWTIFPQGRLDQARYESAITKPTSSSAGPSDVQAASKHDTMIATTVDKVCVRPRQESMTTQTTFSVGPSDIHIASKHDTMNTTALEKVRAEASSPAKDKKNPSQHIETTRIEPTMNPAYDVSSDSQSDSPLEMCVPIKNSQRQIPQIPIEDRTPTSARALSPSGQDPAPKKAVATDTHRVPRIHASDRHRSRYNNNVQSATSRHHTKTRSRKQSLSARNCPRRNEPFRWDTDAPAKPGDGSDGHQLMDWSGNWAPAPLDWEFRPAFGPHKSVQLIQGWLDATPVPYAIPQTVDLIVAGQTVHYCMSIFAVDDPIKSNLTRPRLMGPIVPRAWIPERLENNDPRDFWTLHKTCPPDTCSDCGLDQTEAWWDCYPGQHANFLLDAVQPPVKGIDTEEETIKETTARKKGMTSQKRIELKIQDLIRQRDKTREDIRRMQAAEAAYEAAQVEINARMLKADMPIVIRDATNDDVSKITALYNTIVGTSVTAADMRPVSLGAIRSHMKACQKAGLPYIIATEKPTLIERHKPAVVLGVAYASRYSDQRAMWRFTCEVEIYVHPTHQRKGVGKCLMDQLLSMLDTGHVAQRGYETEGETMTLGPTAQLRVVLIQMPFVTGEKTKSAWLCDWLSKWGFELVMENKDVGIKFGKDVSLATWRKRTYRSIDIPPLGD